MLGILGYIRFHIFVIEIITGSTLVQVHNVTCSTVAMNDRKKEHALLANGR
jgi:hypothetical protein